MATIKGKKILPRLSVMLGCVSGAIFLIITGMSVSSHFAKAADVEALSCRLEIKCAQDQADHAQGMIYMIEDRTGTNEPLKMAKSDREQYRFWKGQLEKSKKTIGIK